MVHETNTERPRIVPMIAYEDGPAALDWMGRAFGFREVERMTEADGTVSHAETEVAGGRIFLATPTKDYEGRGDIGRPAARPGNGLRSPG